MSSRSNYNLSSLFILLFFVVNFVFPQSSGYKVVIDPGHGGKDPGNI